jgi:hypothetical protein
VIRPEALQGKNDGLEVERCGHTVLHVG